MKYPDRYDIPSEHEIRQEIGRLFKLQKQNRDLRLSKPAKSRKRGIGEKYERVLVELLEKDPNLLPRNGYRMFLERFEDTNVVGFPTEKQFRSKISNLKSSAKKF